MREIAELFRCCERAGVHLNAEEGLGALVGEQQERRQGAIFLAGRGAASGVAGWLWGAGCWRAEVAALAGDSW